MSDTNESRELPKYRSHKTVRALKIKEVCKAPGSGFFFIHPEEEGYAPIRVDFEYIKKHDPQPGGYYVVYEDGYKSFSPAKAFEEGNTRI